jgi:predicted acylesterase/phospholipase RssA
MRSLVTPNLRSPWRSPLSNAPQRRFVTEHVSERALIERGASLAVSVLDLRTGREVVLRYPGADLPLVDGIMAAVATPGLIRPTSHGGKLLAEVTLVESVPMAAVAELEGVGEIVAVLTGLPADGGEHRRYSTWRAVMERALAMNLTHDVRQATANHAEDVAFAGDGARVASAVTDLAGRVTDHDLSARLRHRLAAAVAQIDVGPVAELTTIVPTRQLEFPLWRFRPTDLAAARTLGRADAQEAYA